MLLGISEGTSLTEALGLLAPMFLFPGSCLLGSQLHSYFWFLPAEPLLQDCWLLVFPLLVPDSSLNICPSPVELFLPALGSDFSLEPSFLFLPLWFMALPRVITYILVLYGPWPHDA